MPYTCCLCGKQLINGWGKNQQYGNNPAPLKQKGECCDKCNRIKVIPARFELIKNRGI